MLFDRLYEPKQGEILYHYCRKDSFEAICKSGCIRFSSLLAMNDTTEMRWGYRIWDEAARRLADEIDEHFLNEVKGIVVATKYNLRPLSASFSMEGDLLSQWRAYADDGLGFSIGFDASVFPDMPVRPLRVSYDESQQIDEAMRFIKVIYEVEKDETEKFSDDFFNQCAEFGCDLAAFKNPAFHEEKEVRFVHLLNRDILQNTAFRDSGGTAFGGSIDGQEIGFLKRFGENAEYIDIDFTNQRQINPIKEVILGPKNDSPSEDMTVFLEGIGLYGVDVRHSQVPYR